MNRIHEFFDDYVANPVGELACSLGGIALAVKGGYEAIESLTADVQLDVSDVMEPVGYGVGATVLGCIAITAAKHYRASDAHKRWEQ